MDLRQLTEEQRRDLYETVLGAALTITRSRALGEELTQEAFLRLMTTRPWDASKPTSLERHLFGIVKSLLSGERISKRPDRERRFATEHALLSDGSRSPEAIALDHAESEREEALGKKRLGDLRAKLASQGSRLELQICDAMAEGITKRAELATRTGRQVEEIAGALRRIRRITNRIVAAERGEDDEGEEVA